MTMLRAMPAETQLPGFQIVETLHTSGRTVIVRVRHPDQDRTLVAKLKKSAFPTQLELAQMRREFAIIRSLEGVPGVIRAVDLVRSSNGLALLLEDIEGVSLDQALEHRRPDLPDLLRLWIRLVETLGRIHAAHIIHKDIKPQNVILNRETGELRVIDFNLSSQLSRETSFLMNPETLQGSLLYISPEQTGRMNRAIDYRSDFYSLGVMFYELLVSRPPFLGDDPLELIHQHIARPPVPPIECGGEGQGTRYPVPAALSAVIMKLLAKTAEERYQSAFGLRSDLEACLSMLDGLDGRSGINGLGSGEVPAGAEAVSFQPGVWDVSDRFQIPQTLYGREREIARVMSVFARVAEGATELVLISGHAGIGKSVLVSEVHKPIVQRHGFFIAGKFDQFRRDLPYSAVIQAFQDIIKQLLTEDQARIAAWKEKLLAALGPNAPLICTVIPEVELIIGQQPPLIEVATTEAMNRFHLVFQKFIRVFADEQHPLTVFIDDLQWADTASLGLLQTLVTDPESRYLLLIGAYRHNEVDASHPLLIRVEQLRKLDARIESIFLEPLDRKSVRQLLEDTLRCPADELPSLLELVMQKTEGNPFFINEVLRSLYQSGLINFNPAAGRWVWDLVRIEGFGIPDNVVHFMATKIERLDPPTRDLLKMAACVGNKFRVRDMALLLRLDLADLATVLGQALHEGLIVPTSDAYRYVTGAGAAGAAVATATDVATTTTPAATVEDHQDTSFKFVHDRVQFAAYSLLDEQEKKRIHLDLGRRLQAETPAERRDERLIDIVSHMNKGRELVTDEAERVRLAEWNLAAGRRAKSSAAFQSALEFFSTGLHLLSLLAGDAWSRFYTLALDLSLETAELEYVNTNYDRAEELYRSILARTRDPEVIARICVTRIDLYSSRLKMEESLQIGLEALATLGHHLPAKPNNGHVLVELLRARMVARQYPAVVCLRLPEMTDPRYRAIVRILGAMITPAYLSSSRLMPILGLQGMRLHIKHGNSPDAPLCYFGYACIISTSLKAVDDGEKYAWAAMELAERYNHPDINAKLYYQYANFQRDWKHHVHGREQLTMRSYEACLEIGKLSYASYCLIALIGSPAWIGQERLEAVLERFAKFAPVLKRINQEYADGLLALIEQYVRNLRDEVPEGGRLRLVGDVADADRLMAAWKTTNNSTNLFYAYYFYAVLHYLFEQYDTALEYVEQAGKIVDAVYGQIFMPYRAFFHALTLCALATRAHGLRRRQRLRGARKILREMKAWAHNGPANFTSKRLLIEAELARLEGRPLDAMEHYDEARKAAQANDFIMDQCLASELAAKFYFSIGRTEMAQVYLHGALNAYGMWGATAKVRDLSERLLGPRPQMETPGVLSYGALHSTSSDTATSSLDLTSVVKSSQSLSAEFDLGRLLRNLMAIVLENAGAHQGYLLLADGDQFTVEAEASLDHEDVATLRGIRLDEFHRLPKSVINYVARTRETQVLHDASQSGRFTSDPYIMANRSRSILCMPLLRQGQLTGILYLENHLSPGAFTEHRVQVLNVLASQAAISIENARLYHNLKHALEQERLAKQAQIELNQSYSRFVPQEFLRLLGQKDIVQVSLGDHVQREMTVLFSDIRSFTSLSESMTPNDNFKFINSYLRLMGPVVREHNGFIDKYIGDAIMALFDSTDDAFRAALAMLDLIPQYNDRRRQSGYQPIYIGISVNSGPVMLGTVGEHHRMEGTVIADAVNLASRLEGLNKLYGTSLNTTEQTLARLSDPARFPHRLLGLVQVPGKKQVVSLAEILHGPPDEVTRKAETADEFHRAIALYREARFSEAIVHLETLARKLPDDQATLYYLERARHYAATGAPEGWAGVETIHSK